MVTLLVLLGLFVLLAVAGILGLTADSRDLRPHRPVHAPSDPRGQRRQVDDPLDRARTEQLTHTVLPPHRNDHQDRP